ncbi:MAG: hypothetical protein SFY92_10015 [Verrucomicrobiae bacterium]|nr:hypothetical protein [Verrucomicrobiae bacterium]
MKNKKMTIVLLVVAFTGIKAFSSIPQLSVSIETSSGGVTSNMHAAGDTVYFTAKINCAQPEPGFQNSTGGINMGLLTFQWSGTVSGSSSSTTHAYTSDSSTIGDKEVTVTVGGYGQGTATIYLTIFKINLSPNSFSLFRSNLTPGANTSIAITASVKPALIYNQPTFAWSTSSQIQLDTATGATSVFLGEISSVVNVSPTATGTSGATGDQEVEVVISILNRTFTRRATGDVRIPAYILMPTGTAGSNPHSGNLITYSFFGFVYDQLGSPIYLPGGLQTDGGCTGDPTNPAFHTLYNGSVITVELTGNNSGNGVFSPAKPGTAGTWWAGVDGVYFSGTWRYTGSADPNHFYATDGGNTQHPQN